MRLQVSLCYGRWRYHQHSTQQMQPFMAANSWIPEWPATTGLGFTRHFWLCEIVLPILEYVKPQQVTNGCWINVYWRGGEAIGIRYSVIHRCSFHGARWISTAQLAGRISVLLQCTPGVCLNSCTAPSPSPHLADLQKCGHWIAPHLLESRTCPHTFPSASLSGPGASQLLGLCSSHWQH